MMNMSYLLLLGVCLLIGAASQGYVRRQLAQNLEVDCSWGITGREAAERMLAAEGVHGVEIRRGGEDDDFFDPKDNSITLDPDVYDGRSVTAVATACHEVGHAVQHAVKYAPMTFRSALFPLASAASNLWFYLLLFGAVLQILQLQYLAIAMYAVAVFFQIATLPVEFDASRRALAYMDAVGMPQEEHARSFGVLRACALTYVAAALVSVLQLIYLLASRRD